MLTIHEARAPSGLLVMTSSFYCAALDMNRSFKVSLQIVRVTELKPVSCRAWAGEKRDLAQFNMRAWNHAMIQTLLYPTAVGDDNVLCPRVKVRSGGMEKGDSTEGTWTTELGPNCPRKQRLGHPFQLKLRQILIDIIK